VTTLVIPGLEGSDEPYNYYVVDKDTGVIYAGNEYREDAVDASRDLPVPASQVKVMHRTKVNPNAKAKFYGRGENTLFGDARTRRRAGELDPADEDGDPGRFFQGRYRPVTVRYNRPAALVDAVREDRAPVGKKLAVIAGAAVVLFGVTALLKGKGS
jgi:hypothetical protein